MTGDSQADALIQRSLHHRQAGELDKAFESARTAYALARTDPGTKPFVEHLLGSLYKAKSDYGTALELYESAYQGMTQLLGESAPQTEIVLRAIADTHHQMGHLDVAHEYCMRALRLTRSDPDHRYAAGCHLLARIRHSMGDHAGAQAANQEANEILVRIRHSSPEAALLYAANISQDAMYNVLDGDLAWGISQQRKALKLRQRYLPSNDVAVAESLTHLGTAELAAGHPRRALRYLRKALAIHERMGEHAHKGRHINDRLIYGRIAFLLGRASAESDVDSALTDARAELGEHHPVTIDALEGLAEIKAAERPEQALSLLSEAVEGQNRRIGPVFATRSDQERLIFVSTLYRTRDLALSALVRNPGLDPAATLQIVAQRSGLSLEAIVRRHQAVLSGDHPDLAADVERLREIDESLAGLALGQAPSFRTMRDWERERDQLQTRLAGQIPELRRDLDLVTATVERLAGALPAGSMLLQYVRFDHREDPRGPKRKWYGAFSLFADKATFADLGPAEDIDRLVAQYSKAIVPRAGRDIRLPTRSPAPDWRPLATALYRAVIEPLRPPAGTRLVVVPDGSLHRIPMATLIGPQDRPIVADTVITHLGSARDLLLDRKPAQTGPALVIADPAYGDYDERQRRSAVSSVFRPLPGSAEEGRKVAAHFGTNALTGPAATKKALTTTTPPTTIHLATHGFWLGGAAGPGLAFADANLPGDHGILSTPEIAHLNLTGTQLVVLSACETGLGAVHDAEGVFGLCRAFTIAGAHAVVSSLWSIPDRPTARLMIDFYENLRDADPAAALARTQAAFAAEGRHVSEWGAFACYGAN